MDLSFVVSESSGEFKTLYVGNNATIAYDVYEREQRNPEHDHVLIVQNAPTRTEEYPKQVAQRIAEAKAAAAAEAEALANRAKTDAESAVEAAKRALAEAQANLEALTPPAPAKAPAETPMPAQAEEPEKPAKRAKK